jgi:hypothetical protein
VIGQLINDKPEKILDDELLDVVNSVELDTEYLKHKFDADER